MNETEPEPETPTTEDVRSSYTVAWAGWDTSMQYDPEAYAEFDRWLAGFAEEKFLEGARWALLAEGHSPSGADRAIANLREAETIAEGSTHERQ